MGDFLTGYVLGHQKARRAMAQATMPLTPGKPLVTARGVRRVAIALVALLLLLLVVFIVYAVALGIQHHLIYFARG